MTISKRYYNDGKSILKLNEVQAEAVQVFKNKYQALNKIDNCQICSSSEFQCLSEKDRYGIPLKIVICNGCGFIFANPYYDEKVLKDFYEQYSIKIYRNYDNKNAEYNLLNKYNENYIKGKKIYDYLCLNWKMVNDMFIAEVGVGAGGILGYFKDKKNQVIGTDYDTPYLKYGYDQEINLIKGGVDELVSKNVLADVVIYSDVLEHIPDLKNELKKVRSILKDDGCLYIGLPSAKNLEPYNNDFLRQLQNAHAHYFSLKSLKNIMKKMDLN
jgi:2-polyprenyl-3-methyl-5-hydroxy-6-metoxy-1,4-benzoquinol methylase